MGKRPISSMAQYTQKKRREKGWTQIQLDEKAGLPIGTVGQLESGIKTYTDVRIEKLATALGIAVKDMLLNGVEQDEESMEMRMLLAELAFLSRDELLEELLHIRRMRASRLQQESAVPDR